MPYSSGSLRPSVAWSTHHPTFHEALVFAPAHTSAGFRWTIPLESGGRRIEGRRIEQLSTQFRPTITHLRGTNKLESLSRVAKTPSTQQSKLDSPQAHLVPVPAAPSVQTVWITATADLSDPYCVKMSPSASLTSISRGGTNSVLLSFVDDPTETTQPRWSSSRCTRSSAACWSI